MKKIMLIAVCFMAVIPEKAPRQTVSHHDVREAKRKYLCAKNRQYLFSKDVMDQRRFNGRELNQNCDCLCLVEARTVTKDLVTVDSLTWVGLREIRKQKFLSLFGR